MSHVRRVVAAGQPGVGDHLGASQRALCWRLGRVWIRVLIAFSSQQTCCVIQTIGRLFVMLSKYASEFIAVLQSSFREHVVIFFPPFSSVLLSIPFPSSLFFLPLTEINVKSLLTSCWVFFCPGSPRTCQCSEGTWLRCCTVKGRPMRAAWE